MARIHTHYDNLKVSRKAPQEVIRAAYKALSQKYHPDKNPGDAKAARIMAILNSAYGTLADPTRRREHDEWIAAEEWEIEWLESTKVEDERGMLRHEPHWEPETPAGGQARPRAWRSPLWWLSLGLCLALGCAGGIVLMGQSKLLAAAPLPRPDTRAPVPVVAAPAPLAPPRSEPDNWAVNPAAAGESAQSAPQIATLAVTEVQIPARRPDCDTELHTLVAPNGEPWPSASGYLEGTAIGNPGEELQIVIDNSANASPVLAKVVDLDKRSTVRQVFVLANERWTVEKLAAGRYALRYQNIEVGGSRADCLVKRKARAADVVQAAPDA
ncbi:MAG: J domain-containing protein [Massilia sp.]